MSGVGRTLAALLFPVALSAQTTLSSGAVASPDHYGAVVAQEILAAGGNAVDAAVAVGFALAVTYPEAGNIGGGGFMTLLIEGKPYFLDFREVAPAAATATMFLDDKGEVIDELSLVGNLAAGVPGTVKGLAEVHHRFGKLSWRRDLAPAIKLARQGFKVEQELIEIRDESSDPFRKAPNFDPHFGQMQAGKLFRQPELAQTLERIAKGGEAEFYRGKTAELILAQMARGPSKGIISRSDLAGYQVKWRAPLQADWRGMRVITAPPPSSGGIALLQMLTMKQDAAALFSDVALNGPKYIHLIAEIEKRVFADRAEYLGDPDFVSMPTAQLLDPAYLARRAAEISVDRPSQLKAVRAGLESRRPPIIRSSIAGGNAVATTYTLNGWFGSGVVVEGAGFLLNDEMDDFSAKPGAPNLYGVVGADANQIRPFAHPCRR